MENDRKKLKTALNKGGGPPPGFKWNVLILNTVFGEANFLTEPQYSHLVLQIRELAKEDDPSHSLVLSIGKIEDIYELRERGGVLGGLNVRIFYGIDNSRKSIVLLSVIQKQNNGKTPLGDKRRAGRRWRKYLNGDFN